MEMKQSLIGLVKMWYVNYKNLIIEDFARL